MIIIITIIIKNSNNKQTNKYSNKMMFNKH